MDIIQSIHFPTLIYQSHKPEWLAQTLGACEPHFAATKKQDTPTKIFPVYQTGSLHLDPNFNYFTNYILAESIEILESQGYDLSRHELYFEDCWAQEVMTYGHHFPHVHGNSQISGFYFIECPQDGIFPLFYDPRPGKVMIDLPEQAKETITAATQECNYKPTPGMFMFFNSWLPHSFQLNESDSVCKFIHFNIAARRRYEK